MRLSTKHRAHLSEAFRWTPTAPLTLRTLAVAAFAMGVPVLAGLVLGKPALGLVIGLGSMLLANEVPGQAEGGHGLAAIGPALLAVPVALVLARFPWGDAAMVGLSVAAATLVNWSRPAAGGAVRFIVFLILNLGLAASGSGGAHRGGAALLFGIGALWRTVLRRLFGRRNAPAPAAAEAPPTRVVTARQRRIHFRRTLRTLAGWQYPIRLGFGLTAAVLLRDLWPERHFGWVVLTIALLTPRALEHLPVQITQRVAGTLGGVALAGLILHAASGFGAPGHVALGLAVVLLGIAAPLARAGNYAVYCLLSTPVILLAMDAGAEGTDGLLVDRMVATLGGAAVILVANVAMDWWLGRRA